MPPVLISAFGLLVFLLMAWCMSTNRRVIPWRIIASGLALQLFLGWLILATSPGQAIFEFFGDLVTKMLSYVDSGSEMVFSVHPRETDPQPHPQSFVLLRTFAFNVLPTVIFFSSLMGILYYIRIMPMIVRGMGWVMQRTLKTSGAESLAAAANVFVGHTEAPLVIRPYLAEMTKSELNAVMVGGFATISSGLIAAYAGLGISPMHLIAASVISAPAALLIAKIMQPETESPKTMGGVAVEFPQRNANVIDAAATGATEGLQLVLNIGAMLIAFLALIAMGNGLLGWLGTHCGYVGQNGEPLWTFEAALGTLFAPIAWLMGIPWSECRQCGELLGVKIMANELVAFLKMGEWLKEPGTLSPRSTMIMTYALAGFSNFGAIGIQIGGIGGLAPSRRSDLAKLGIRAMFGGAIACCMTACIAGIVSPLASEYPAHVPASTPESAALPDSITPSSLTNTSCPQFNDVSETPSSLVQQTKPTINESPNWPVAADHRFLSGPANRMTRREFSRHEQVGRPKFEIPRWFVDLATGSWQRPYL